MRKIVLAVGIGIAAVAAGVGIGVANAAPTGSVPAAVPPQAAAVAAVSDATQIPPATVAQRRANEKLDGDPRTPAKWGPAQFEAASVAERALFAKAGATNAIAAQRDGTTDTYQILLKAQKGGSEFVVTVDYLNFTAVSIDPV